MLGFLRRGDGSGSKTVAPKPHKGQNTRTPVVQRQYIPKAQPSKSIEQMSVPELCEEIKTLTDSVNIIRYEKSEITNKIKEVQDRIKKFIFRIEECEASVDSIFEGKPEIDEYQDGCGQLLGMIISKIQQGVIFIDEMESAIIDSQKEVDVATEKLDQYQKSLKEKNSKLIDSENYNNRIYSEINVFKSQISELRDEINSAHDKIDDVRREQGLIMSATYDAHDSINKNNRKISENEINLNSIKAKLISLENEIEQTKTEISNTTKHIENINNEIASKRAQIAQPEPIFKDRSFEIEDIRNDVKRLEKEIEDGRQKESALVSEIHVPEGPISDEGVRSAREENDRQKDELQRQMSSLQTLSLRTSELQDQLRAALAELGQITTAKISAQSSRLGFDADRALEEEEAALRAEVVRLSMEAKQSSQGSQRSFMRTNAPLKSRILSID